MTSLDSFVGKTRIAYFSMEIAIIPEMHTYSGGLGVLAGDTARSCADLNLPMVFLTLLSREGYLRQEIGIDGGQIEHPDPWKPELWAEPLGAMISVRIEERDVWIKPWLRLLRSPNGNEVPVLLLDTRLDENLPEDRDITDRLYGAGEEYRLKQEIVLGVGGARILDALGFGIETFHLNEGHAALLAAELLRRHPHRNGHGSTAAVTFDVDRIRDRCVFTTHTPVEAGHDKFSYELVQRLLGNDFLPIDAFRAVGGTDRLNMTCLALHLSGFVNGVARSHGDTARRMFPAFDVRDITNGVHAASWVHPALGKIFDVVAPGWGHEPELLINADRLNDVDVWAAHETAKVELIALVAERAGRRLDPALPILGFARRMTGYKRPDLIFTDLERLRAIARRQPFQLVMAGKAHPQDEGGKQLIVAIHRHMRELEHDITVAFVPNYDLSVARTLVAGADVWLNTPMPPMEASGTSGMKAALNGVLNLSVLDGWWSEGCIEGETGWAVGEPGAGPDSHAASLFDKLEETVLPLFREDRARWTWMMKEAISKLGSRFNSQRMMRRYASEAYLR